MLKVCFITPNILPVPNVRGGAIEGLMTNMIKIQEKERKIDMIIVSIYDKDAVMESSKYKNTKFIYIKKDIRYFVTGLIYHFINIIFKKNKNTYNHIALTKIKKMNIDYIVAEGGHYESYNEFLKYFDKNQLILHLHHEGQTNEIIDNTFSRLIGVSKFVADKFKKTTKSIKTTYLNNGIDISFFDKKVSLDEISNLKDKYNVKKDDFVIIFCGRLTKEKGVLELIKAVKLIDVKNIKLMILGSSNFADGKENDYTRKLKEEIDGYDNRIFFTGYINNYDIYKYYAIADIACLPSMWEDAAPLTCIEAMICKKVVLATRSGGAPEYLSADSSIIVEKDFNVINNLKDGIMELYSKRNLLPKMGWLAYNHAIKFNSNNYYFDFINILDGFNREDCEENE